MPENTAPPSEIYFFLVTQTKLFKSIMTEFWPVTTISPLGPCSSSREEKIKRFE